MILSVQFLKATILFSFIFFDLKLVFIQYNIHDHKNLAVTSGSPDTSLGKEKAGWLENFGIKHSTLGTCH